MVDQGSEESLNNLLTKLKEAKREMEAYATETQDNNAQKLYRNNAQQLEEVINNVNGRSNYIDTQNDKQFTNQMDLE